MHPSHFVSKIVCPVPNTAIEDCFFYIYCTSDSHANAVISRHAYVLIWCPECWKWHFRASRFQNFMGSMPPDPPRLMGLTVPCSQSRLFSFNQLPTLKFYWNPWVRFSWWLTILGPFSNSSWGGLWRHKSRDHQKNTLGSLRIPILVCGKFLAPPGIKTLLYIKNGFIFLVVCPGYEPCLNMLE